jgi:hypothetical protein
MWNQKLLRNILLAFLFFAIGRVLVIQMGNNGVYIILGLVGAFYLGWWLLRRLDRKGE